MSGSGSGSGSFEQHVQKWVETDNQVRALNERLSQLRETRRQLEESMSRHAKEQSWSARPTIQISDGKLTLTQVKVSSPLTFKYVEKCLRELLPSQPEKVDTILEYLHSHRETKMVNEVKRVWNSTTS